jgi:hypothetical protein
LAGGYGATGAPDKVHAASATTAADGSSGVAVRPGTSRAALRDVIRERNSVDSEIAGVEENRTAQSRATATAAPSQTAAASLRKSIDQIQIIDLDVAAGDIDEEYTIRARTADGVSVAVDDEVV